MSISLFDVPDATRTMRRVSGGCVDSLFLCPSLGGTVVLPFKATQRTRSFTSSANSYPCITCFVEAVFASWRSLFLLRVGERLELLLLFTSTTL